MGGMIAAEFLKLRRRPLLWWMLGIMLVITTGAFVISHQVSQHTNDPAAARLTLASVTLPVGAGTALGAASALWGILLVIAIAVVVGNEFQYGTLRVQLAMGLRRTPYILAKAIAVYLAGVLGLLLVTLFGIALSLLITVIAKQPVTFAGAFGRAFWQTLGVQLLGTATTFSLALFLTLLARQVVAGVAIVLGYTILEGTATGILTGLGGGWATAANFLLTPNTRALAYGLDRSQSFNRELHPPAVAAALLVGYAILFIAAALLIFNKRDVKGAG